MKDALTDRDFPTAALAPDWVHPVVPQQKPFLLQQAAYFSFYVPFILWLVFAIIWYGVPVTSPWHHCVSVVYAVIYDVTIIVALVLGAVALIGGIKCRCIEIYGIAFWGCLFNGTLLVLLLAGVCGRLFS
jgi:hypothetical protein